MRSYGITEDKGRMAVIVCSVASLLLMGASWHVRRDIDRVVDERLQDVRGGRVMWSCRDCPQGFLVPSSGEDGPRSWVPLEEMPEPLVKGILAVEDHRFYRHGGLDVKRTIGAFLHGVKNWETPRGTSTLTQQVSRTLFLSRERTLNRKFKEALYAFALEDRLDKKQILELYLNTVPLGGIGPFELNGFSDAARGYLGKNLRNLTIPECALLVGMVQRPSTLNPKTRPEAAQKRRNLVLRVMHKRGAIDYGQMESAQSAGITTASLEDAAPNVHFLQLAAREFRRSYSKPSPVEAELTLDIKLQKAAMAAVEKGLSRLNRRKKEGEPRIEAALVALDPRTGAVRALVGGRSFAESQINRALSQRQPGSVFKPFVYAAGLEYGTRYGELGPYSEVNDFPRQFQFAGKRYQPHNYHGQHAGRVTLQEALNRSLNIPAVRVAEAVGYDKVAYIANAAGLKGVEATPSAALGSYEVSPLMLAAAYTAFANGGVAVQPHFIESIRDLQGQTLATASRNGKRVMRGDTASRMALMLSRVNTYGTAAEASRLGFPTAGKTGTDDDGWFAGFSSNLVCVVWVGYDDNRDLGLEGAKSALPIWIDFMGAAHKLASYKGAQGFPDAPAQNAVNHVDPPPTPEQEMLLLFGVNAPQVIPASAER